MKLHDFQQRVEDLTSSWDDTKSPVSAQSMMMMMTEEIGELARALRKTHGERWGHAGEGVASQADVAQEVGDVLFLLARVALLSGVRMEAAAESVIDKIERRLAKPD